jgi:hypothetical protein
MMDDPKAPLPPGRQQKESIVGVHHATEDDFRGARAASACPFGLRTKGG